MLWKSLENMAIYKDPKIKLVTSIKERVAYKVRNSIELAYPNEQKISFLDVLENRHSTREFAPMSISDLGGFLYLSCRTRSSERGELGLVYEKRNYPSAGALHSIDVIVSDNFSRNWYIYNSKRHTLDEISVADREELQKFKESCFNILGNGKAGYLIWYVCDFERLACKYEFPETLAFRESGGLSAIQSLVSEYLNMSFCTLGANGSQYVTCLSEQSKLLGVGTAIVGGKF